MIAPSPAHAMWLLARLRLRRLLNVVTSAKFRGSKNTKSRAATPNKRRLGYVLGVVMALFMMLSFMSVARQSMLNVQCSLNPASHCVYTTAKHHERRDESVAAQELNEAPFAAPVLKGLTMQLSLLLLVSILLPLGSKELAQPDWDLEWLVTLPARRGTLLWGRLFERTLANPVGWTMMLPALGMLAWYSGLHWSAPLVALAGAAALLPLAALVRTLADTGLRMALPPSQLRNLQALAGIVSMPFMYLAMSFGMSTPSAFVFEWARQFPAWALWTPPGLLIQAINPGAGIAPLSALALLTLEIVVPLWLGVRVLRFQLRDGVVASSSRESARKAAPPAPADGAGAPSLAGLRRLLPSSPIQRRELRLLSRDRNFLVQSVLLPVVIIGSQLMFNGKLSAISELGQHPTTMAGIAFGMAAYMLMMSAFQTLNNEGQSLWMLFTFPRSIQSVLKEKAQLWAVLAMVYPLAIFGLGLWQAPQLGWQMLSLIVIVLAGVPVFSTIAVALGVFACDPLAQDVRTRVRPSYLYLYMTLAGLYTYAIFSSVWSQQLVVMVLTACLAQALWQKARDELPYLLDNAASPPARVSTSDGLIAAMLFFVVQGITLFVCGKLNLPVSQALLLAFGIAGLFVYLLMRLVYWLGKTREVPVLLNGNTGRSLLLGLGGAAVAIAAWAGYMVLLRHFPIEADPEQAKMLGKIGTLWLLALTVIAAPLCEEFIFRGLIFGGLRRSMGMLPAIVMSAAVFAIVHPPLSMLPVFVVGLCTAFVYERSKSLLAPMLVHALYNAVVVGFQLLQ
ncbi:MAG: type II CAAX endopeptidase family protein [Pseudomonadota bacterium]